MLAIYIFSIGATDEVCIGSADDKSLVYSETKALLQPSTLLGKEVIKWFNVENATSLIFSQIEIMFGRKVNKKMPNYILKENSNSPY